MSKLNTVIKPAIIAAGLVGIIGFAAAAPAQAAESGQPAKAVSAAKTVHFQGKIQAVGDGYVDIATGGTVIRVEITNGAYWISPLYEGASADVTAWVNGGVYSAKVIATW
ncbi:hypothetical protein FCH28_03905 [Streptomyces piniterrae]|uniref:DUF5666 domain-containing protein n=1 Tax=Streptomyces piniterrae TaxID=2571125 RepID=A0A4U0NWQ9_9ACTN|nr:hypothetical protein [Streptomyces piniterrae]TJZ59246.1 hypothetical protein FCH28_03905 [Streptomyces piniterrae]